jgi:hypothetical protein
LGAPPRYCSHRAYRRRSRIQSLREYTYSVDGDQFKFMKKDTEGYWRLPGDPLPLMYSIKAMKL